MFLSLRHITSGQGLSSWIADRKVDAIYADQALRDNEPFLWAIIEGETGGSLGVAFSSEDGRVRVLIQRESASGAARIAIKP